MEQDNTENNAGLVTLPDYVVFVIIGLNLFIGLLIPLLISHSFRQMFDAARGIHNMSLEVSDEQFRKYMRLIRRLKKGLPTPDLNKNPMYLTGNMFLSYAQIENILKELKENPEVAKQIDVRIAASVSREALAFARKMPMFKTLYIDKTRLEEILKYFIEGKNPYSTKSPLLFREVGKLLVQAYQNVEDDFSAAINLYRAGFVGERLLLLKVLSYYGASPLETLVSGIQELFGPQDLPVENTKGAYNTKFMSLYSGYILKPGSKRDESEDRSVWLLVCKAFARMVNKKY